MSYSEIYSVIIDCDTWELTMLTKATSRMFDEGIQKKVTSKKWLQDVEEYVSMAKRSKDSYKEVFSTILYDKAEWVKKD